MHLYVYVGRRGEAKTSKHRGGAGSSGRDQGKGVEELEVTASTKRS